jgi:hypothetical protein
MKEFPKFSGDHELVGALNRLVECVKERTPLKGGEGTETDYYPEGFRIRAKAKTEQATRTRQVWL